MLGRLCRRLLLLIRKRLRLLLIGLLFAAIQVLLWLHPAQSLKQHVLKLTYLTRPLWDSPEAPFTIIDHYYAPGMSREELCKRHGWAVRKNSTQPKVYDAVLFSIEIELLLVRHSNSTGQFVRQHGKAHTGTMYVHRLDCMSCMMWSTTF